VVQGYFCSADPAGLSHAEITDLLLRLGVWGKELDPAFDPRMGVVTANPAPPDLQPTQVDR
jgi:hypothetical protein